MLRSGNTYEALYGGFSWALPQAFNIAEACCTRFAQSQPDRVCLYQYRGDDAPDRLTYGALEGRASALALALKRAGIGRGDRVAIMLPQGFDTVVVHMAVYKLAAVAVPLALLFGEDAIAYRLASSGARAIVTDSSGHEKLRRIADNLPTLETVIVSGAEAVPEGTLSLALLTAAPTTFAGEPTAPDTPAMMIFTSGTTGPPKGALHGHRVLLGHLPGVQMHHEFLPVPGDILWTPADWAWAGGLLNVLLPGLFFGVPVVATPAQKFDAPTAFHILEHLNVRNAFIPPTALRMMKTVENPAARYRLDLRTVGSGGEALGRETYLWGERTLGLTINEFYGQTECNLVLASCAAMGVTRPGAIGKAVPGHRVAIIDETGQMVPAGKPGQIAIARPDPVMFLTYWQNEAATQSKFIGDWMTTGDAGVMDEEGYVAFFGRDDDVITSSGYRIGPGEIEDCLHAHPAVQIAAAVGKPDPVRTEKVKVYVVLRPGIGASPELAEELRLWVKTRLSAHEYPREVAFVDALPLTTTGKVIRRELRSLAAEEARREAGEAVN
ncbi:AMP-binding protein [Pararhizobium haloflavum]|uniref:AMP-binding protein n=1 Tax=Pararhizobium haloflavum TaxID=2037914 RepID=UPI000C1A2E55|nr:AMP-binding protein [Pararhizobium haloflavum]